MSVRTFQFGTTGGEFNQDARIYIKGPGRKSVLALVASYQVNNITLTNQSTLSSAAVWGRLQVFDGFFDPPGEWTALSPGTESRVMFDAALNTPGPHTFLLPLAELAPNPTSSSTLSIILSQIQSVLGNARQNILVSGGAGTFTVTFGAYTTGALAWNAAAAVVAAAINLLPSIIAVGGVTVTLTVPGAGISLYHVSFNASGSQPLLQAVGAAGATASTIPVDEGGPLLAWAPLLTAYGQIIDTGNVLSVR